MGTAQIFQGDIGASSSYQLPPEADISNAGDAVIPLQPPLYPGNYTHPLSSLVLLKLFAHVIFFPQWMLLLKTYLVHHHFH